MPPTKRTAAVEGGNGPGGGLASSAGDLRPESERRPAAKVASCLRWCRRVGSGAAVGPSAGAPVGPNGRRRSDPIGFHRMPTSRFDMSTFAEKKIAVPFFFHFYRIFSATLSLNAGRRDWRGCGRGFLFEEVMFQAVSVTFQINPTGLYLISHIVVSKFTTKRNLIFKNLTNIFSNRTFIYYRKKRVRKMWNWFYQELRKPISWKYRFLSKEPYDILLNQTQNF